MDDCPGKVVVAGAGAIGCFVGGHLAAAGRAVALLARPRIAAELASHGLTLTDRDGAEVRVAPSALEVATDPTVLAGASVVLVTVKSGATVEVAEAIARHAPASARVVSLQNGIDNARLLQESLPGRAVFAGMVGFNVAPLGHGRFHRGTDGKVVIDAAAAGLASALSTAAVPIETHADMRAVAWGKLLINLNNALNALSGLPLRAELADRAWRRLLAASIAEGLAALAAAGIEPAKVGAVPPHRIPTVLRLPDWLFGIVASAQLRIDPKAGSSMSDDLAMRRRTEVDQLQGAVVALAAKHGTPAPLNAAVLAQVKAAEARGQGSPRLQPGDIAPAPGRPQGPSKG